MRTYEPAPVQCTSQKGPLAFLVRTDIPRLFLFCKCCYAHCGCQHLVSKKIAGVQVISAWFEWVGFRMGEELVAPVLLPLHP